jgi:hypothetical protein
MAAGSSPALQLISNSLISLSLHLLLLSALGPARIRLRSLVVLLRLIVPPREPALEPLVLIAAEDSLLRNLDRLAFALKLL